MRFIDRAKYLIKQGLVVDKLKDLERAEKILIEVTRREQGVEIIAEKERLRSMVAIEFSEAYQNYKAVPAPNMHHNPEFEDNEDKINAKATALNQDGFLESDVPDYVNLLEGPPLYQVANKSIKEISAKDQHGALLRYTDGRGGQGSLVFTDKNGRLRKPTPEEFTRDETGRAFDGAIFNPFMHKAVESGGTVDGKASKSFHGTIEDIMSRRNARYVGDHRRGIMMNSSRSFNSKKIEETVNMKALAKEKLTALIGDYYFRNQAGVIVANMIDPVAVVAPAEQGAARQGRARMLAVLGITSTLTPALADFEEKLIAIGDNPVKWEQFIRHAGLDKANGDKLFNHVKAYNKAARDVNKLQEAILKINKTREGAGNLEVSNERKQAKILRHLLDRQNAMKKLNNDADKSSMRFSVRQTVVKDSIASTRGKVDEAKVSGEIHAKIIDAYDQKDVPVEVKQVADDTKDLVSRVITQGNEDINIRAEFFKESRVYVFSSNQKYSGSR